VQQQRAPTRGFPRPSPQNSGTFIPPQSVRPFANPMGYHGKLLSPFSMDTCFVLLWIGNYDSFLFQICYLFRLQ
jgi:hypothetical protein